MSRLRPRPNHLLVFAVRGKRKVGSFYTPTRGSVADFHVTQELIVAELGEGCAIAQEGVTVGTKGYIIDSYEYDPVPMNLWPTYREILPPARVAELEGDAAKFDGFITCNVLHENSIFAVEEVAHG